MCLVYTILVNKHWDILTDQLRFKKVIELKYLQYEININTINNVILLRNKYTLKRPRKIHIIKTKNKT